MWNACFRPILNPAAFIAVALLLLGTAPVPAASDERSSTPEVLDAIVAIEATVPRDARSAATLGTERGGSGVVIDGDGLILTIGYLVLEADSVIVRNQAGRRLPATVLAYHGESGFGLLKASGDLQVRPMKLGSARDLGRKDPVLVASFGGVKGLMPAIVADRRDFAGAWEYLLEEAIFTAPPHPLAAGAALIGPQGSLLGIGYLTVGTATSGDAYVPGNMFVPIDVLKPIMGDLIAEGRAPGAPRPWLGLYTEEVKGRIFVQRVAEGGPADRAGLRAGDIVLKVGSEPVASPADLYRKVWGSGEAGAVVPLTVLQDADLREIAVTSGDRYKWFHLSRSF